MQNWRLTMTKRDITDKMVDNAINGIIDVVNDALEKTDTDNDGLIELAEIANMP